MVSTAAMRVALIHIPVNHIHIFLPNIHGIKGKKKVKTFPSMSDALSGSVLSASKTNAKGK